MADLSDVDRKLLSVVSAQQPATIQTVVTLMTNIDSLLPEDDGLKWFNKLYLKVTEAIDQAATSGWADPVWLTQLDVVFAGLYFTAITEFLNDDPATASAWDALFESRHRPNVDRIQFALAGMNAHINHDLAIALVRTDAQLNRRPSLKSPEHADYERVNGILAQLLPSVLTEIATGVLGGLAEDTGRVGRLLAIWDVAAARDLAWTFASCLQTIPQASWPAALTVQDRITGVAGRGLLLPLQ